MIFLSRGREDRWSMRARSRGNSKVARYQMTSTDVAGRPAGRSVHRSAGLPVHRCSAACGQAWDPGRDGLNGRRNAVKPFCHSRRSMHRVTGDIQRRITRARSPRGISRCLLDLKIISTNKYLDNDQCSI